MTVLSVLLWLLVALSLVTLLLSVIRYVLFLISNRRAGQLERIRDEQGGLFLPLLNGILSATWNMGLVCSLFPLSHLPEQDPEPGDRPIILVHGLYHNRSAWAIFKRRLKRRGYHNVFTYQYNSWTRDFDDAVAGLEKRLDRILGPDGNRKAVFIAHSLGGLVVRSVAAKPTYRDRVAGMVTMGSPHGGADLARIGVGTLARSLVPGGPIARRMAELDDADCPKLSIHALMDDIVFPLNALQPLHPGWQSRVCPGQSHVSLLFSSKSFDMAVDFLEQNKILPAPDSTDEAMETDRD